ncbi:bacteriocin [Paucibacter sp. DJ2R-2]|uniref:bacteriocin n=1 Tax=Paucibacter sp. DJ2R-2 TaxID=2893558 RepID=UPI0021E4962F|nr:bacteriocin [Paucibacter sp. DJ2R-2]MCV2421542.1 bacteriocin [Paucibacter sp. DJ4R-1]MCV2438247.1 bacteriocin [Paucibacter sp. DJ2R-2]
MNRPPQPSPNNAPRDEDLVDQAHVGHGVPSQDPDPAAQQALAPEDAAREANSVLTGGGLVGGAALGAVIGVALGGPVGVLVGSSVGAVAGALGGSAASGLMPEKDSNPGDSSAALKAKPAI